MTDKRSDAAKQCEDLNATAADARADEADRDQKVGVPSSEATPDESTPCADKPADR